MDGKVGDGHVTEVSPHDKPLTHPGGASYASTVKRPEPSSAATTAGPSGKPGVAHAATSTMLSTSPLSPSHFESYAGILKRKGGLQDIADYIPSDPMDQIDEILNGAGNVWKPTHFYIDALGYGMNPSCLPAALHS